MDNNLILDWWTPIHALVGFCAGFIIPSRLVGYSLIIGYEAIENRYLIGPIFESKEGMLNVISDTVVGVLFYELGKKYGNKKI